MRRNSLLCPRGGGRRKCCCTGHVPPVAHYILGPAAQMSAAVSADTKPPPDEYFLKLDSYRLARWCSALSKAAQSDHCLSGCRISSGTLLTFLGTCSPLPNISSRHLTSKGHRKCREKTVCELSGLHFSEIGKVELKIVVSCVREHTCATMLLIQEHGTKCVPVGQTWPWCAFQRPSARRCGWRLQWNGCDAASCDTQRHTRLPSTQC